VAFVQAAKKVFEDSDEGDMGLREVVISILAQQICLLENSEVEALVDEFNGLAAGVLRSVKRSLPC
jgi:hypothetical protein